MREKRRWLRACDSVSVRRRRRRGVHFVAVGNAMAARQTRVGALDRGRSFSVVASVDIAGRASGPTGPARVPRRPSMVPLELAAVCPAALASHQTRLAVARSPATRRRRRFPRGARRRGVLRRVCVSSAQHSMRPLALRGGRELQGVGGGVLPTRARTSWPQAPVGSASRRSPTPWSPRCAPSRSLMRVP